MPRNRFFLALLALPLALGSAGAGPGLFTKRTDPERVPALIVMLASDPDEKQRKAAADELGGANPRLNPEAAAALTEALRKDASASVRAEAAAALGQLGQVFPAAGQTLEAVAANDSSPLVRLAAKRTLWEYHLNGYRSPRGADGTAMQTEEPPIASPTAPRPEVIAVAGPLAPATPRVPALPSSPGVGALPPVAPPPGPRVLRPNFLADLLPNRWTANRPPVAASTPAAPPSAAPPILNVTGEPPLAKRVAVSAVSLPPPLSPVPPPTIAIVPALIPPPRQPDYIPTLPPFTPDLPPVALPPDATPELAPHPTPKFTIPPTLPPGR